MRKEVFYVKYRIYIVLLLTVSAIAFSGCGRKKEENENAENMSRAVLRQETEETEEETEPAPTVISYSVKLVGKTLSLYEVNGENKKLINSIEINPEFYPSEDIERLRRGVEAYCLEEGYEILENFAN